jgi:hypothetical protein
MKSLQRHQPSTFFFYLFLGPKEAASFIFESMAAVSLASQQPLVA